jgi:hypothetical protein
MLISLGWRSPRVRAIWVYKPNQAISIAQKYFSGSKMHPLLNFLTIIPLVFNYQIS